MKTQEAETGGVTQKQFRATFVSQHLHVFQKHRGRFLETPEKDTVQNHALSVSQAGGEIREGKAPLRAVVRDCPAQQTTLAG